MNRPSRPPVEAEGLWSVRDGSMWVVVAQIALIIGGSVVIAAGGWPIDDVPIGATLVATVPFWIAIAVAARVLVRRHGSGALWGDRPRPLDAVGALAVGALGQLVAIPLLYALVFRLTSYDSGDLEAPAQRLADSAPGLWGGLVLVVMAGLGAPLFEEVLYRGVFMPPLVAPAGRWGAIALSAVVFAAFHFQPLQLPGLALLGATAGWFRLRRGGLVSAILVHGAFNMVTVVELMT